MLSHGVSRQRAEIGILRRPAVIARAEGRLQPLVLGGPGLGFGPVVDFQNALRDEIPVAHDVVPRGVQIYDSVHNHSIDKPPLGIRVSRR